jgi:hypothetical protein
LGRAREHRRAGRPTRRFISEATKQVQAPAVNLSGIRRNRYGTGVREPAEMGSKRRVPTPDPVTCTGTVLADAGFPSFPLEPSPQHQAAKAVVVAQVRPPPALTQMNWSAPPPLPLTFAGTLRIEVDASPTSPNRFSPQQ